ncbi:MAG TPA: DUF507 family protein [Myxococcota bacterium]|nr:DUF507 family protein [Myxococcota bacterium]
MKLYRAKVPAIASECLARLAADGDIELDGEHRADAEADLAAIMEDYLNRDNALREEIRDHMSRRSMTYDQYGKVRTAMAEGQGHPLGDDVERYLARQFSEYLMISRWVEEVYADDKVIYKKLLAILKNHHVDENAIRDEARSKIKNIREGTVEFEVAMEGAVREVKKRKGLIG